MGPTRISVMKRFARCIYFAFVVEQAEIVCALKDRCSTTGSVEVRNDAPSIYSEARTGEANDDNV